MKNITGKIALVTGGSTGFGKGIAEELSNRGAKVFIVARKAKMLNEVAKKIDTIPIVGDVTKPEDWDKIFTQIIESENRLDILINNAGAGGSIKPVDEQQDGVIMQTIDTNLTGVVLGCKRAATIMKRQKSGTIINISSICAKQAWEGWSVYGAAKAGLEQFTRHLYVEMRPYGVKATVLTPSWGATDFAKNANIPDPHDEVHTKSIMPNDIGKIVVDICELPGHLVIPEMTLLPLIQEIQAY